MPGSTSSHQLQQHVTVTTEASEAPINGRIHTAFGQRARSGIPNRISLLTRANNGGRPISLPRTVETVPTVRSSLPQTLLTEQPVMSATGFHTSHMSAPIGNHGLLENYHIGRTLGQGAYATVRLCLDKRNQQKYAVKIYEKYKLTDPMKKKAAQREITVLKRLEHPGIIQLHDLIDTPKQIFIVTDYIKGISLQQYSKSVPNRIIRETTARRIFK